MKNSTKRPEEQRPSYIIESVDNALKLLFLLHEYKQIRVTDASMELGVSRSTAHRLLAMLQYHRFVQQDPATRVYMAGSALREIGLAALSDLDIRAVGHPSMEQLAKEVGETVHLIVLQEADMLFLDAVESNKALRVGARTGQTQPAHASAAGKALLAELSLEQFQSLYPQLHLPRLTPRTLSSRAELERELQLIRERGYATNFAESEDDLHAVSAVIYDHWKHSRAALTVSAPASRMPPELVPEIAKIVSRYAAQIGEQLI